MTFYGTLAEAMRTRAQRTPQELALIFIGEDGVEQRVTTGRFHEQALKYACTLQQNGVQSGDVVVLVLRHATALLYAFWGALYLGAIPSIFPFLTEKLDETIYSRQVLSMAAHAQARAVVTYPEFKRQLAELLSDIPCPVLDIDELHSAPCESSAADHWPSVQPEAIAFLQHSSGTTGLQKGVALSHRAVLNQIRAYGLAIDLQSGDIIVSWLPLYHDMGLIAGFIMPLVMGAPVVLLSPFYWVRDPITLFRALHLYRGTLCWLPNFAYNHCLRGIRQSDLQGLDLSRWRMTINCSEPVRHDSQQEFLKRFAPHGLRAEALATCYAMAENTFAVTQSTPGQEARIDWVDRELLQREGRAAPRTAGSAGAIAVVSCGHSISGTVVQVVDNAGRCVGERIVGEVWIRSNCMLDAYYRRPNLTSEVLHNDGYLSGDMGYLADEELYITGRKKDLIIAGGKNVYPQDVEALATGVEGIYPGRAVAFGVVDERLGTEAIVLVCELTGDTCVVRHRLIETELRQRILHHLGVTLRDVRLVNGRWLLKTSSGKVARSLNRDRYLQEFRT